jgi:trimethylamine--corrinoid protein Co-methyltransferase
MVAAELGLPVLINSTGVAGVTAPVTLVGAFVQMNAELLGALVVIQLHRPGTPVLYAGHPMVMDMKTGMPSHGLSELGLATAAFIDIGRSYGLPTSSPGLMTDSCSSDAMAASEKWATGYPPVMVGADVSGGGGGLACQSTISLEQLVIDDDLYGCMFAHVQGIRIDEESLASEVIHKVGPGGSYLAEDHTLRHFLEEYRYSQLANRLSAAAWERAGSADVHRRAADRVGVILATPPEALISPEQSRELTAVLLRAEQALAALELPT